jgi:hypothetical protein
VTIPSCEESISIIGAVNIASCDDPIDPARLTFLDRDATPLAPSFSDPANGYFEYTLTVTQADVNADPNFNFFTITYTDALGNASTIQPGLTARQSNAFDAPPTIVYPSNEVKLTLDPCEACIDYQFSVTAVDECDGDVTPEVRLFPNSTGAGVVLAANGNDYDFCYPVGNHKVVITATDNNGRTRTEEFKITVAQDEVKLPNIACNDLVHVTLEKDCKKLITPDMVTEGNFGTCYPYREEDFTVIVYDGVYEDKDGNPSQPNEYVEECGTFNYVVMWGPDSDEYCWGKIKVEDKTPPVVTCPKDVYGLVKLDADATKFRPGTKYDIACGPVAGDEVADEDEAFHRKCNPYCGGKDGIDFNWLVCTDVDKVFNVSKSWSDDKYAYFMGKASVFDCSATELVSVKDRLEEADCNDYPVIRWGRQVTSVIYRTFTYKDKEGNQASCVQKIYFFRPQIYLPECKVELDQCKYPDVTASNSKEKVDPVVTKTAPYYVNAVCQKIYLTDHTCNLTLTFEDQVLPGPDYCGVKIIRIWTFLDWCWKPGNCDLFTTPDGCTNALSGWDNKKRTYEQHIIIGDKIKPVLECPTVKVDNEYTTTQVFSTGPFNCTAVVDPLPPVVKNDECKGWDWEFELYGDVTDPKTGLITKDVLLATSTNHVVYGVGEGVYKIKYIVNDKCRNSSELWCNIVVKDKIAPVAVCDDQLNISIGGANTTAEGLARVTAADVDEGSWDNCELVGLHVSREIEDDCLEIYAELVDGLVWPTDYDKKAMGLPYSAVYLAKKDVPAKGIAKGDTLIAQKADDGTYFSWWADAVYFTCCDISADATDKLIVELRATDKWGNTNVCWQDVLIEDKLPPRCETWDQEILCTELDFSPADAVADPSVLHPAYGTPEEAVNVLDNCGATIDEEVSYKPGNCGTGVIERKFTVTDGAGRTAICVQKIRILEVNDYDIKFPGDVASAECGVELEDDIAVSTDGCDILAVNRDTARFEADGNSDACYKLFITYKVINWCEYDGETLETTVIPRDVDEDNDLAECTWLEAQYETGKYLNDNYKLCSGSWPAGGAFVVKVFAETKGVKNTLPTKILVRATCPDGNTYVGPTVYRYNAGTKCYEEYCSDDRSVSTICANLTYEGSCWTPGFYEYTQIVKVYDNTAPTIDVETDPLTFCAYGTPPDDCGGQVDIVFQVDDECTPDLVKVRQVRLDPFNGGNPQDLTGVLYTVTSLGDGRFQISGKLPVGAHTFIVSVADGCGNLDGQRIPFEVVDCKSPAPICIQTLSIDLMPIDEDGDGQVDGGMNTVWATDYLASDIDDCSPFEDEPRNVKYFVFKDSELPNGPEGVTLDDLTADRTSVVFTCDEVNSSVMAFVFALDAAGNFDYCMVMTTVKAGLAPVPCGDGGSGNGDIAGLITDESDNATAGVTVQLSGQASMSYVTDDNGDYAFTGLIEGYDYSVTPSMDNEYLNGVSTFDLVLISKHILNVKPLNSPYKLIAADVNNSRSITTLDLIQLRKLILSVDTKFANNRSWRFVRADYVFPNTANPWAAEFPEVLNINNLSGDVQGDFVAIKVGDVNNNAAANGLMNAEVRNTGGTFELLTADEQLTVGEEYTVPFTGADMGSIQGYQFTLQLDRTAVELVDVIYGVAQEDNFGIFAQQGLVTASWNGEASADDVLFSLVLRAKAGVKLSEALSVNSRLTRAEAYSASDAVMDVALNFGQGTISRAGFELYQNTPNPFQGQTVIGFNLPEATEATIKVSDVQGRMLKLITGQYNQGYNEIRLNSADLNAAGVLYYTVETAEYTATKKMIIIE